MQYNRSVRAAQECLCVRLHRQSAAETRTCCTRKGFLFGTGCKCAPTRSCVHRSSTREGRCCLGGGKTEQPCFHQTRWTYDLVLYPHSHRSQSAVLLYFATHVIVYDAYPPQLSDCSDVFANPAAFLLFQLVHYSHLLPSARFLPDS